MTPRKPGETDADYLTRIGDVALRWHQTLAEADRAIAYCIMLSMLGRRGGFDGDDLEGWQRRAAFLRGASMSNDLATAAYGSADTLAELHVHDFLAAMPPDLRAAFDALDAFNAVPRDESRPIPQADIDAVTAAAATVAERLKQAIENLKLKQ